MIIPRSIKDRTAELMQTPRMAIQEARALAVCEYIGGWKSLSALSTRACVSLCKWARTGKEEGEC